VPDKKEAPSGKRFSHVYLPPGDLLPDSKRMRRRIGASLSNRTD
jgi:hypothetical protein